MTGDAKYARWPCPGDERAFDPLLLLHDDEDADDEGEAASFACAAAGVATATVELPPRRGDSVFLSPTSSSSLSWGSRARSSDAKLPRDDAGDAEDAGDRTPLPFALLLRWKPAARAAWKGEKREEDGEAAAYEGESSSGGGGGGDAAVGRGDERRVEAAFPPAISGVSSVATPAGDGAEAPKDRGDVIIARGGP